MMKKYICQPCGYIYDPAIGDPDEDVAAGTALKTCLRIGFVRYVVRIQVTLRRLRTKVFCF